MKEQKIKQIWIPYHKWEDLKAGMWRKVSASEFHALLELAIAFTGNHLEYGEAMKKVVFLWPQTMLHNLTNKSLNQRAFVGHCAACWKHLLPENVTREAWKHLSDLQRFEANIQAQMAINYWKTWHLNKGQYKIEFPTYD